MRITAAVSRAAEAGFTLETVELDPPREDEILVRITAGGLCHTDLAIRSAITPKQGPVVLGHEGAGVVEEVGEAVAGVNPGDRVVLSYRSCRRCGRCLAGRPAYCEESMRLNNSGRRVDGSATIRQDGVPVAGSFFGQSSFATHALASTDNVVVVAPDADLTTVAPLGCGFQTGAGAVLNVLRPGPDAGFVVYGAGGVGLSALLAAKVAGAASLVVVEPVAERRALAERLGATAVIDPAAGDVVAAVREATGGGPTHALDTTGIPAVVADAALALAPTGTLVVVGLGEAQLTLDLQDLMLNGKTVRGCIEGDAVPQRFIPELLDLHAAGRFPVDELITTYSFKDINQAVDDQRSGRTVKPVLVW
ncbi:NAD(P)-dependent alcohol dehydrogenase [Streptomyces sp. 8K308]|uniref:NAD(P)-dependent alcohol dehydrogenase n=1 Tax=Streptomyces sp. 8K308 TaxID=2530388 RepID=UPI00104F45CC|nr:NAD(P)-dependent alcohol dehydrogenase [Streptomyces sp. 8K308]TDC26655.1 NAD(P)-dependent alcohol dehydrogenase [Streptomyces sp. 8K308]